MVTTRYFLFNQEMSHPVQPELKEIQRGPLEIQAILKPTRLRSTTGRIRWEVTSPRAARDVRAVATKVFGAAMETMQLAPSSSCPYPIS